MIWLLCISVALTTCKEKVEIIEVVRAIKTMTVKEQATEQILKFSGLVAAVDDCRGLRTLTLADVKWCKEILDATEPFYEIGAKYYHLQY